MADQDEKSGNDSRGEFLIPRCKTLRISAGLTISKLAREADVDRNTIAKKIERNHGVREVTAHKVFNVLNSRHQKRLIPEEEIKKIK